MNISVVEVIDIQTKDCHSGDSEPWTSAARETQSHGPLQLGRLRAMDLCS